MKRFALLLLIMIFSLPMLAPSTAAQAQGNGDLIVLNDSTPGIDVVINPSPNTTGLIALEVANAAVTISDAVGNVVFQSADPGVTGIEFNFAPNAGMHTLIVERLPGAPIAHARITSLPEMAPPTAAPQLVDGPVLALDQEADFPLNESSPSSVASFSVADDSHAIVTARFPGAPVTAQLVNTDDDSTVATLYGSLIDGIRFKVDAGSYDLVLVTNNNAQNTVATVGIATAPDSDFADLVNAASTSNTTAMATTAPASSSAALQSACTLTVGASSVNLRSGPGTGYSVLGYAFRGDTLTVGGTNTQGGWLLVGTDSNSGWISSELGTLSSDCANLRIYDIPYLEAATPQITIQQPQVPVYHGDDDDYYEDHDEHENDDHDSYEDDHYEGEHEEYDD